MRARKRADWPLAVYRYWVQLEPSSWSHLPEAAKQETEGMRTLWNQLVGAFERRQVAYRELLAQLPQSLDQQDVTNTLRPALRQLQQAFFTEVRRLTATCPATWANREFILRQFLTTTEQFFKKQSGPPQPKLGAQREIHFHHRFTSGGVPVQRIFGRSHRLHLEPVPAEAFNLTLPQRQRKRFARTNGTFQVRDTALSFATILHRPLPQEAYLKNVSLIGRQIMSSGYHRDQSGGHPLPGQWNWSLHLTLEIPPEVLAPEPARPRAVLELRMRVYHDGHLRIGVLTDSTGREEAIFLPEKILTAWQHRRVLQGKTDQLLEETKKQLRQLQYPDSCSPAARRLFDHLSVTRAPGLWRLLQLLEETDAKGEVVEVLRLWADRSTKLLREARGLERRYRGQRDWFYHNVALQLCRRYRQIIVTTAASQDRTLPEQEEKDAREAATYRHLTSPSRFLLSLHQAAAKTATAINKGYHQQYPVDFTGDGAMFSDPVQRG